MLNIRQTSLYADFMNAINWQVEKIDGVYVYIKKLPFLPAIIKIQRQQTLPSITKLKILAKKYRAKSIIIEPSSNLPPTTYRPKADQPRAGNLQPLNDPYIHTKTIHVDLTLSKKTIFSRFTSAKRRAVRRAQKLGVKVEVSYNIEAFIRLKNRTSGLFLGFLSTHGFTRHMWKTFYPDHARVVLGYLDCHSERSEESLTHASSSHKVRDPSLTLGMTRKYIAGILLIYSNSITYYWMASATQESKKLFAPTLLTWEAIKFSKKQGCTVFDFEGVFDERFPKRSRDWKGFSKFKEGFGGKPVNYPQPFTIRF